ncbi:Maltose O-acetyltransferase [compost metagenome]
MSRSQKQRMLAGEPYIADCPELAADAARAARWMQAYNASLASSPEERLAMLRELFGEVGEGVNIRPPFHCDYGCNIRVGSRVFMNFNCIILDVNPVTIGDGTQVGPGVQILTADHPRDPVLRSQMWESGKPVSIGSNVWIGAGALILPGVTIGDDAIVGAGSVVTRDVEAGATVMGNPARIRSPMPVE